MTQARKSLQVVKWSCNISQTEESILCVPKFIQVYKIYSDIKIVYQRKNNSRESSQSQYTHFVFLHFLIKTSTNVYQYHYLDMLRLIMIAVIIGNCVK